MLFLQLNVSLFEEGVRHQVYLKLSFASTESHSATVRWVVMSKPKDEKHFHCEQNKEPGSSDLGRSH
jgi:hypothetical protein